MNSHHHDDSFFSPLLRDGRNFLTLGALSLLGAGLFCIFIATTRYFLPHDAAFLGMTARDLCSHNACRILHFMIHNRVSFGGGLIAIAILHLWLIHFPLKDRQPWAWWTLLLSNLAGFVSFLSYLGFGYLDRWHAAGTLFLVPCVAMGLLLTFRNLRPVTLFNRAPIPSDPRHKLGRSLLLATAVTLITAGIVITVVSMTVVFVPQDLQYLHTSAAELNAINPRLLPLIAHDRAGFGAALFNVGLLTFACTWFSPLARHLRQALALSGAAGFSAAIAIHSVIGYNNLVHVAPGYVAAFAFALGIALISSRPPAPSPAPGAALAPTA